METNIIYSVVIPVYNSYEGLEELYSKLKQTFLEINSTFETIFVDDYSIDKSWEILKKLKTKNIEDDIVLIKLAENFGQHKALICGIDKSKGKFIITLDDDLQIYPEEIKKLIEEQKKEDYDLVYGSFNEKKHSKIKKIGSYIINSQTKLPLKEGLKPSSFRLFKAELKNNFNNNQYNANIFIDTLLLWNSRNISAVEVIHRKRKYKSSSYSTNKLFSLGISFMLYSTNFTLKFFSYLGVIGSIISFVLGVRYIYKWVAHDVPLGYTSIIVAILFSTSIILLMFSILGGYINELYNSINKKPPYLINKIIK